jgi:hypothetical protein
MEPARLMPPTAHRRVIYVSDADGEILPWLESIAEDQRRKHPGRRVTVAGVAKEVLSLARGTREIEERLRR